MTRDLLRLALVVFTCHTLAYAPLLRAEQLSLPTSDLAAPKISQEKYIETVEPGKNHEVIVTVTDNVGVKQVVLYYRVTGTEAYKSLAMQNINKSDDYRANITADQIKSPGIEYYVQAMDFAGNTLLHGYSFSPISVKTVSAGTVAATPSEKVPTLFAKEKEEEEESYTWYWVGLGVLALAAGGGGGGGGGSSTPTATLTVTTAEPIAP
ncbi:MAG: hypothetical protein OEY66_09360 [Gammaproteobacteria bacterium]|nr:hypothetical protein [Gammaproteobacteria bacterium]